MPVIALWIRNHYPLPQIIITFSSNIPHTDTNLYSTYMVHFDATNKQYKAPRKDLTGGKFAN
jgi:hypothetical protein